MPLRIVGRIVGRSLPHLEAHKLLAVVVFPGALEQLAAEASLFFSIRSNTMTVILHQAAGFLNSVQVIELIKMRHVFVSHMCAVLQPLIHSMPILPNLVSVPSTI